MAGPITWRNVAGPSVADASRPLAYAEKTIGSAFDQLGKLAQQAETADVNNWKAQRDLNTQSFLNEMHKYRTPEQLEAARASGAFDQMLSGFGAQVDQAQVRGALDTRLNTLQNQQREALRYQDEQLNREQAPIKDRILSMAVQGDKQGALAELAKNPNLRGAADIHKAVVEGDRSRIRWDHDLKRFTWDEQEASHKEAMRPGALTLQQESIANQRDQRLTSASQRATAEQQRQESSLRMNWATEDRNREQVAGQIAAARAHLKESGNEYAEGVFDASRYPELLKTMRENKIGDDDFERHAIINRLGEKYSNGLEISAPNPKTGKMELQKVPVPMTRILQAVLGSKDQIFNWRHQGWANEVEKNLDAVPKDTYFDNKAGVVRSKLAEDLQAWQTLQLQGLNTPALGSGRTGGGGKK